MTELSIIQDTKMLSNDTFRKILEIEDKIIEGYENRIIFRAPYLMEVSVLNDIKHPTPDAKYWQANLERSVMYQNLVMLSYDYRENKADIEIKKVMMDEQIKNDTPLSRAKAMKLSVQIERLQTQLVGMKKEAEDQAREIVGWTEIMDKLEPQLEFSSTDQNEHMAKSYPLRFARQKELIRQVGASDMNGAMNILSLYETAFNNPKTLKLMDEGR